MESLCCMFSAMSISKEEMFLPSELAVDEVPSEVKNVCNLMNAIFYEAVAAQVGKLCKERCQGCEVDHPSQRRHDCLMLSLDEEWVMYGLEAVERVLEKGTLRRQFIEAVRVLKLRKYDRAEKHQNLERNHEVTLEFLKSLSKDFDEYQSILNYLMYWSED